MFRGLKTVQNNSEIEQNQKQKQKYLEKKKKRKISEKILPQDQKEKFEHRESSRIRNQPRKNYKTFIPQSKIVKKVEFQKQL